MIAPQWVLTAAHCLDAGSFRGGISEVVAGSLDVTSPGGQHLQVWRAYRDPNYQTTTSSRDYALLRLTSNAKEPTVELADADALATVALGCELTVAGWGDTRNGSGLGSDLLLHTQTPYVALATCKEQYEDTPAEDICTGANGGGHSPCQGDSGGPLFSTIGGKQVQIGIDSMALDCGGYAWFAGVPAGVDWTLDAIAQGETEIGTLGTCVDTCDVAAACREGEDAQTCGARNNTCLCACGNAGLCSAVDPAPDEQVAEAAPEPGPDEDNGEWVAVSPGELGTDAVINDEPTPTPAPGSEPGVLQDDEEWVEVSPGELGTDAVTSDTPMPTPATDAESSVPADWVEVSPDDLGSDVMFDDAPTPPPATDSESGMPADRVEVSPYELGPDVVWEDAEPPSEDMPLPTSSADGEISLDEDE